MASYSPARTRESVLVGYALLDHARTLGIEPDLLGPDAVVIDGQDIPRPGAALPFGSVAHMAETMARLVGDAHVGLRLGSYPHPFDFGLAGYHAAAAENAESFVGRCYDLVARVSTVFEYRLTFGPKRGEFVLRPRFRSAGLRHLAEINLVCFWQGMSRFVDPDFEPFEVRFAHGAKEGGTHYRNLFQCRALFDQPDYALFRPAGR